MFHVKICVEYNGIRAAVHVTILVLSEHLLNLKNVSRPGCSCEVCDFNFLFCYLYCARLNILVGKFNNCHITHILDLSR